MMLYFIGVVFCAVHSLQLYVDDCPISATFYAIVAGALTIFGVHSFFS